jgi:hypothetical protein
MHIENGPITRGKDGKTRLHFEIVIEESYAPGTLHALRREFYGVLTSALTECLQRFDTVGAPSVRWRNAPASWKAPRPAWRK